VDPFQDDVTNESCTNILLVYTVNVALLQDNMNIRYRVSKLTHFAIFGAKKRNRENKITGLTFSRHSSGISGSFPVRVVLLRTTFVRRVWLNGNGSGRLLFSCTQLVWVQ
jgi:hypothetical protein